MNIKRLLATTALCFTLASPPAHAFEVTNPISDFLSKALSQAQVTATAAVETAVAAMSKLQNITLIAGFNQVSNYLKGQTASMMQLFDASNTANATFQRQVRNAGIVADHSVSPAACLALDQGQSASVAGAQADRVTIILSGVTDARGEGGPGNPAYSGAAQAAEANRVLHLRRYCGALDVEAGICGAVSQRENGDQRAASLFGQPTYAAQADIDAANDYASSLLQPTPPPPLRADARKGLDGVQAEQQRKAYNARMSLSRWVTNGLVGMRASAVVLSADQQAQQRAMGRASTANGSEYEAIDLEVSRRYGNVGWNVALERMPTAATILREVSRQLAFQAHLTWLDSKLHMQETAALAAMNAADAERDRAAHQTPTTPLPLIGAR